MATETKMETTAATLEAMETYKGNRDETPESDDEGGATKASHDESINSQDTTDSEDNGLPFGTLYTIHSLFSSVLC